MKVEYEYNLLRELDVQLYIAAQENKKIKTIYLSDEEYEEFERECEAYLVYAGVVKQGTSSVTYRGVPIMRESVLDESLVSVGV